MKFNGQKVMKSKDLSWIVAAAPVGETVTVQLLRDGKTVDIQAKVGNTLLLLIEREQNNLFVTITLK